MRMHVVSDVHGRSDALRHAGDGAVTPVEEVIIHGDFHPGNVLYSGYHVSAVLDYDYAAPGSVLRDIGDGLMFFAATRGRPFDPDDIWSLAQAWISRCRVRVCAFMMIVASQNRNAEVCFRLHSPCRYRKKLCRVQGIASTGAYLRTRARTSLCAQPELCPLITGWRACAQLFGASIVVTRR